MTIKVTIVESGKAENYYFEEKSTLKAKAKAKQLHKVIYKTKPKKIFVKKFA